MRWIYWRLLTAALTVFCASNIIFFLIRLLPAYQTLRKPLYEQYINYLQEVFMGNLGRSTSYAGIPVIEIVAASIPWTIFTVSIGFLAGFLAGVSLGISAAYKHGSFLDSLITALSMVTASIPNYIFAFLLLLCFSRLFPMFGAYDVAIVSPGFSLPFILNVLHHATLPILSYFVASWGIWTLYMRGSAVSVLGEDYVHAAKARGLPESRIAWKYVGRNAILPLFTLMAINLGYVLGGSTMIEDIFAYPGIGYYMVDSVRNRDYPLMQGLFFMLTVAVTVSNLMADLLYSRLDPRVKFD